MVTHVLLNPASGNGRARRRWRELERDVRAAFDNLLVHESRSAGDLGRIASELAGDDALVLAAGGDGTSHEVLNGLLANGPAAATMGWIPVGSGNDMARTMGIGPRSRHTISEYRAFKAIAIDVGRLEYHDRDGQPLTLHFGNSFTLGVTADVLALVARYGKALGGPATYFLGALRAILAHQPVEARFVADGTEVEPGGCRLISVTNGPTFGAGMRIAPAARVDDGRLDLVWLSRISRLGTLAVLPRVYWGGHLRHGAETRRVERLEIVTPGPQGFEIDGELRHGYPPFRIAVAPGGLRAARFGAP